MGLIEMNELEYEKLKQSLTRLKEQYEFFQSNKDDFSGLVEEAMKESIIKRFDICFDTLWKHLKIFTPEEAGLHTMPNSPLAIFRIAHESGVIEREMQERLVNYNKVRGEAAHDYSLEKADIALGAVGDFIADATELYEQMTEEK